MLLPELLLVPTFGILFRSFWGVQSWMFVSSAATLCCAWPSSTVSSISTSKKSSSLSSTVEVVSCWSGLLTFQIPTKNCCRVLYFFNLSQCTFENFFVPSIQTPMFRSWTNSTIVWGLLKQELNFLFLFFYSWEENKKLLSSTVRRTINTLILLRFLASLFYLLFCSDQIMCPLRFSLGIEDEISWRRKEFCKACLVQTVNWQFSGVPSTT